MIRKVTIESISSFFKLICIFFIISQLFHFIGSFVHFSYPLFYWDSSDNFADWFKVMDALKIAKTWNGDNPYDTIGINHMPPVAIAIYVLMALAIKHLHLTMVGSYILIFIIPLFIILNNKKYFANQSNYLYLFLTAYPILCILKTGNIAVLVLLFLVLFIIHIKNIPLSMLFLAIATSIKITPIIFFIYFIVYYRHHIKSIIKGLFYLCTTLLIINYLSVILISNTIASHIYTIGSFFPGVQNYERLYINEGMGLAGGSSFYMAFQFLLNALNKNHNSNFFNQILSIKPLIINFVVVLFLAILYFLKFSWADFKKTIANKFIVLKLTCIIFILFTPITADYYLCMLLIPLFFVPFKLFTYPEKVLYLLLLISKNYFVTHHGISFQVFINPVLLLSLLLITTRIYNFSFLDFHGNSAVSEGKLETQNSLY